MKIIVSIIVTAHVVMLMRLANNEDGLNKRRREYATIECKQCNQFKDGAEPAVTGGTPGLSLPDLDPAQIIIVRLIAKVDGTDSLRNLVGREGGRSGGVSSLVSIMHPLTAEV